jgi:tol-pal system protein YbgF
MAETPPPPVDPRHSTRRWGGGGVRLLLAAALVVPLAACATKADVRDLQQEIRELSARQEALMHELQAQQRAQQDSVRALGTRLGDNHIQISRTLRDFEDQLIRVQELAGLSQQDLAALRDQMDRRPLPAPGATGAGAAGERGGEAQEIYDQAMTQYRREALTSARMGFEEVVERFPGHALTPSARYFLADILAQQGEMDEAIRAFLRIAEFHPDADRVPHALYRVGIIHKERGETAEARSYLERVVNTWPESPAAELAEEALRELG